VYKSESQGSETKYAFVTLTSFYKPPKHFICIAKPNSERKWIESTLYYKVTKMSIYKLSRLSSFNCSWWRKSTLSGYTSQAKVQLDGPILQSVNISGRTKLSFKDRAQFPDCGRGQHKLLVIFEILVYITCIDFHCIRILFFVREGRQEENLRILSFPEGRKKENHQGRWRENRHLSLTAMYK
jgi:hypothetical protein